MGAWDETVTDKAAWDEQVPVEGATERRVPDVRGISGPNYTRNGQKSDDGAAVSWDGLDDCLWNGSLIVWRTDKSDAEAAAAAYRKQGVYYWNGGKASGATDLKLTDVMAYSTNDLVAMGKAHAKEQYDAGLTLTLWNEDALRQTGNGWKSYPTYDSYLAAASENDLVYDGLDVAEAKTDYHGSGTQSTGIILTYPPETRTVHHDAVTHVVHHEGQTSGHWAHNG